MSKSNTKRAASKGRTLRQVIVGAGMRPIDLASKARVSTATVYKALRGERVSGLQMLAFSVVLRLPESEVLAAIDASKGAA